MAYSREDRARARERYVGRGWTYQRVADDLSIGKTTLLRWSATEGWDELRLQHDAIEIKSRELLLRMLDVAHESGDAQATFAAVHAANLARVELGTPASNGPRPKECAVILLDVLAKHPEIGPVVRRHRNEVIRLFLQEVDRLEAKTSGSASAT